MSFDPKYFTEAGTPLPTVDFAAGDTIIVVDGLVTIKKQPKKRGRPKFIAETSVNLDKMQSPKPSKPPARKMRFIDDKSVGPDPRDQAIKKKIEKNFKKLKSQRRPPVSLVDVRCVRCGKTEQVPQSLAPVSTSSGYSCNDCLTR